MEKVQLIISLDLQTGHVNLTGPLEKDVLCLGMMEKAKEMLHRFAQKREQGEPSGVQLARGDLLDQFNRKR